ncbi:GNAT family N-acetyltransferase [Leptothoe sp. PORK10 BA2]|uniref:GNAT family N-acetyltransferase n=1 Tax=Leptothoe sp. PORK10 BA2 TaxID=3110254 RepID=UPI002B211977|nr:GNAT family N-acetyltransferase [Leptothoe sp. PORK10 BA2]MEA5465805.1 GNAT family N-acetyltransferase [Leptothoe sp. PORK10 BA2]
MVMALTIRPGTLADLPAVVALYEESGLDQGAAPALQEAEQWFQTIQLYPNYKLWVAVDALGDRIGQNSSQAIEGAGVIVGTFSLLMVDNLVHHCSPAGVVEGVAVTPHLQGQGIGRRMMEFAIATCRAAGCYKLTLSTNLRRKAAHGFYESLGFEKHGYSYRVEF